MATWDPAQYERFGDYRTRPFHDLVGRVRATDPEYVVDLGCGTGALTATLADRWAGAWIEGFDNSPDMLAEAAGRAVLGHLRFGMCDAQDWKPERPIDVFVSNAALQWVPDHELVLRRAAAALAPGGWLAVQVPGNFRSGSHVGLHDLVAEPRWQQATGGLTLRHDPVLDPDGYLDLLSSEGLHAEAWETTYLQVLSGDDPVLEWTKGSALRPVLDALSKPDATQFIAEYAELLRTTYPRRGYGTPYPFRRIFMVAQRPA